MVTDSTGGAELAVDGSGCPRQRKAPCPLDSWESRPPVLADQLGMLSSPFGQGRKGSDLIKYPQTFLACSKLGLYVDFWAKETVSVK